MLFCVENSTQFPKKNTKIRFILKKVENVINLFFY